MVDSSGSDGQLRGRPLPRMSASVEDLQGHFPVVVIGSGYGGAITASRLARAGQQVCLLERGRELHPGEYPDVGPEALEELQLHFDDAVVGRRTSLYDIRLGGDVSVLVGCGLGGTSLINANVSLEADPRVFDDPRWPSSLKADLSTAVARGYNRATSMLSPKPLPDRYTDVKKLEALQASAGAVEGSTFYRPPINVTFDDGPNAAGIFQPGCHMCGDCVSGCNFGSKNTVLMNYLPDAYAHGAKIFTQVAVRYLERDGESWAIYCQLLDTGREDFNAPLVPIRADLVILSAGTLGSTEILLRSAVQGKVALSTNVGNHFSGNGDVLGFGYNGDTEVDGVGWGHERRDTIPVGPCIDGIIDTRAGSPLADGFVIEDAVIPGALRDFLPGLFAATSLGSAAPPNGPEGAAHRAERELDSLVFGSRHGAVRNTQTFLVMSNDDGTGRLVLEDDRIAVRWPGVGQEPIFDSVNQALASASGVHGATYVKDPLWSKLLNHELITVHPLGGCVMADDAEHGVVNHKGQVFSEATGTSVYENLYVTDGSVVPRPLGVNPLLTISALSERCVEGIAVDRGWTIDFDSPTPDPGPTPPQTIGIEFTERMAGWVATTAPIPDDFEAAAGQGQQAGSPLSFVLTISSDNLDQMLSSADHPARTVGTVVAPALSSDPLTVADGQFNLFVNDPDVIGLVHMKYRMVLTATDGRRYLFTGVKNMRPGSLLHLWPDTTTLYVTLYDGEQETDPVKGRGVLTIAPTDFAQQLRSMRATNAPNIEEQLKAEARFGQAFSGELYHIYGGLAAGPKLVEDGAPPRKKRPLRVDPPTVHAFTTEDGVELLLTRYHGGTKGPVLVSHGLGVSSLIFTIDTIDTNLVEFLFAKGYDIWLLDYRASIRLPAARSEFTGDDIAKYDYPAAVNEVRRLTGAPTVQVIAHCFGSTTFVMAMLGGLQGVRAAVCSQIATNLVTPKMTRLKSGIHMPQVLDALGVESLTAYASEHEKWTDRLFDHALELYPTQAGEHCDNAVCHRISFLFALLYEHAQLNTATHEAGLAEMFGVANIRAFEHLSEMVRKGTVVAADGSDIYMPHLDRLAIPVTFVHGAENACYLPESTAETLALLQRANGANLYQRFVIPDYGHIDCIFGKNAARDVYPSILAGLDPTA